LVLEDCIEIHVSMLGSSFIICTTLIVLKHMQPGGYSKWCCWRSKSVSFGTGASQKHCVLYSNACWMCWSPYSTIK